MVDLKLAIAQLHRKVAIEGKSVPKLFGGDEVVFEGEGEGFFDGVEQGVLRLVEDGGHGSERVGGSQDLEYYEMERLSRGIVCDAGFDGEVRDFIELARLQVVLFADEAEARTRAGDAIDGVGEVALEVEQQTGLGRNLPNLFLARSQY